MLMRGALQWVALLAVSALFSPASASTEETYPSRVVKIVVPAAAGSTTDILARLVAEELTERWSKPVIVVNISGAAMNVGAEHVARAAPDGHTLMVSPPGPIAFNHLLYRNLAYDPRSFVTVAALARIPNVLVLRKDFPANSVQELIAYARANPGKLTYASQGVGSTAHLSAAQLELLAGINMVHIPYRGAQPALNDILGGHVDMFFDTVATSTPLLNAGKVKILAIASPERIAALPQLVTLAESGLPGFRSVTWFALVASPGTSSALAEKINRDMVEILKTPDVAQRLRKLMLEPIGGSAAEGSKFIAEEAELWSKVIKQHGIELK